MKLFEFCIRLYVRKLVWPALNSSLFDLQKTLLCSAVLNLSVEFFFFKKRKTIGVWDFIEVNNLHYMGW